MDFLKHIHMIFIFKDWEEYCKEFMISALFYPLLIIHIKNLWSLIRYSERGQCQTTIASLYKIERFEKKLWLALPHDQLTGFLAWCPCGSHASRDNMPMLARDSKCTRFQSEQNIKSQFYKKSRQMVQNPSTKTKPIIFSNIDSKRYQNPPGGCHKT